jgi:hypothetical protein
MDPRSDPLALEHGEPETPAVALPVERSVTQLFVVLDEAG